MQHECKITVLETKVFTDYQDEIYEADEKVYFENEAAFDGNEQALTRDYAFGQVSYITTYHLEDIPYEQLGYIVTEDFLAPSKGVPLVQRLYYDIFDGLEAAQRYAENFRLHELKYPKVHRYPPRLQ